MNRYEKNGKVIDYVITHKPIKNTYFRVRKHVLQITTNPRVKESEIIKYIDQKFERIYHKLNISHTKESDHQITLWGHIYRLQCAPGRFGYEVNSDLIIVKTTSLDIQEVKKRIYDQELKTRLIQLLPEVHAVIARKNIKPVPFKLKYLKSKYGSYHRKHQEITLNTFLARLDPIYLLYVIYHEYAHQVVFNHSKDFYNLLAEFMPNHKVYQKDLKKMAII